MARADLSQGLPVTFRVLQCVVTCVARVAVPRIAAHWGHALPQNEDQDVIGASHVPQKRSGPSNHHGSERCCGKGGFDGDISTQSPTMSWR